MEYFIAHNGYAMEIDGCDFSKNFDWVVLRNNTVAKKTKEPKSIYCDVNRLGFFCDEILSTLTKPFIFITGCGDYSPQVNYTTEFEKIYNCPLLIVWYMENMIYQCEKTKSLPVGLASHSIEIDDLLLNLREKTKNSKRKTNLFYCARPRSFNVVGSEYNIRGKYEAFAKQHNTICDVYEPQKTLEQFLELLSQYKYSICAHGNGVDPCPTAWYSLALGVTPILHDTVNARSIFEDVKNSVIFVKTPEDIPRFIKEKPQVPLEFLTAKYWVEKILGHIY